MLWSIQVVPKGVGVGPRTHTNRESQMHSISTTFPTPYHDQAKMPHLLTACVFYKARANPPPTYHHAAVFFGKCLESVLSNHYWS